MFNPKLLECAEYAVKLAFVPPGSGMPPPQDPAAMGAAPGLPPSAAAPPPDPAMAAGGAPAPPPMDPAMAGGAPPPADPAAAAAGGAAPPPSPSPGGMDPEMIRMIIREEMAQGGAGAQKPKAPKITPEQMYQESVRTRKMLTHLFGVMNIGLPPDILDDPAPQGQEGGGGGGSSGGSSDSKSSGGSSSGTAKSAIAPPGPINALPPAFPMGKTGSSSGVFQNAEALLAILNAGE